MNQESGPPKPESLRDRTRRFAGEIIANWIKPPLVEVGRWAKERILQFVLGLVLLSVAVIFVLIGGIQGLQELKVPVWATYLGVGALAGVAGLVILSRK